jgi:hypothetical protein
MKRNIQLWSRVAICAVLLVTATVSAQQVTRDDYERANRLRGRFQGLAVGIPENANAISNTSRFWYRKSVQGGNEFVLVDAEALSKRPAFDHEKLAASLNTATASTRYTARTLPFSTFQFADSERSIEFTLNGATWACTLRDYVCTRFNLAGRQRADQGKQEVRSARGARRRPRCRRRLLPAFASGLFCPSPAWRRAAGLEQNMTHAQ